MFDDKRTQEEINAEVAWKYRERSRKAPYKKRARSLGVVVLRGGNFYLPHNEGERFPTDAPAEPRTFQVISCMQDGLDTPAAPAAPADTETPAPPR